MVACDVTGFRNQSIATGGFSLEVVAGGLLSKVSRSDEGKKVKVGMLRDVLDEMGGRRASYRALDLSTD